MKTVWDTSFESLVPLLHILPCFPVIAYLFPISSYRLLEAMLLILESLAHIAQLGLSIIMSECVNELIEKQRETVNRIGGITH